MSFERSAPPPSWRGGAGERLEDYRGKVEADTRATCAAFGEIKSVAVPSPELEEERDVFVEFFDAAAARRAADSLSSRTYDGRELRVRRLGATAFREALAQSQGSTTKKRRRDRADDDAHAADKDALAQLKRTAEKHEGEKARLQADIAHHAAQHKLLESRVATLEEELEAVRASAQKEREFNAARIKALAARAESLEAERNRL